MPLAAARAANGQFVPGRSGNPAGRPKGARNRATLFAEMLREGQSEELIQALVQRALGGDQVALRFCVGRLVPKAGPAPIELALPPGAENDPDAVVTVAIRAMADGEIAPQEAATIARVVVAAHKVKGGRCVAEREEEVVRASEADALPATEESEPASEAARVFRLYPGATRLVPVAAAPSPETASQSAAADAPPVSGQYFPAPSPARLTPSPACGRGQGEGSSSVSLGSGIRHAASLTPTPLPQAGEGTSFGVRYSAAAR